MATDKAHSEVVVGSRHAPHNLSYPNAASREAGINEGSLITLTAANLWQYAKQDDDNSTWMLTSYSPIVWKALGSGDRFDYYTVGMGVDGASAPDAEELFIQGDATVQGRRFDVGESIVIEVPFPLDLKVSSGIHFQVWGLVSASTPPAGLEAISFAMAGYARGMGDSLLGSYGSEVTSDIIDLVVEGVATQYDLYRTPWSAAATIPGLAKGTLGHLEIERKTITNDYAESIAVTHVALKYEVE